MLALAGVERLPPDLADMTIGEFPNLLDSGVQREAVAIFTGPDSRIGDRLLPRLKDVAEIHREGFARILYFDGDDIDVPALSAPFHVSGVVLGCIRIWHLLAIEVS